MPGVSFQSRVVGVTHPKKSVADVRGTDARRRKRDGPEGVTHGFQVSVYKVDPRPDRFARNLFSKDDWRLALFNEPKERRPQVPWILKPRSSACRAERLARTGTSPNRSIVWPSGTPKGERPDADTCEEMALRKASQFAGVDILDTPFIHDARRNQAGLDQVAQPLRGIRVDFVVIRGHPANSSQPDARRGGDAPGGIYFFIYLSDPAIKPANACAPAPAATAGGGRNGSNSFRKRPQRHHGRRQTANRRQGRPRH